MAYTIQALLTKDSPSLSDEFSTQAIDLPQGLKLLPLNETLRQEFDVPWLPFTDEGMTVVPSGLEQLGRDLSGEGRVVIYVEAEFFGGVGGQAMIAWKDGSRTHGPLCDPTAINEALKLLGVSKGSAVDEFAAVELNRYRDTEKWKKDV